MVHAVKGLFKVQSEEAGSIVAVIHGFKDAVPDLNDHVFGPTIFFTTILVWVGLEFLPEFLQKDTLKDFAEVVYS